MGLSDVPKISEFIDIPALQKMMDDLYQFTKVGFSLIDLEGNIIVATGWQEICTEFHRKNPQTLKNCIESDLELTKGVAEGEYRIYRCKNGLVDIVTPLFVNGKHLANIFSGQYFFRGEDNDAERFIAQAEKYGFDKKAYMHAFENTPRWDKQQVEKLIQFYTKLTMMLSEKGFDSLMLVEYATHKQRLASKRAEQLKQAERLAAIGQTAAMVGHDIRNPLTAMVGNVHYLKKHYPTELTDEKTKYNILWNLECLGKNVFYINKIIEDLQDYSRKLIPEKVEANLSELVSGLMETIDIPKKTTFCQEIPAELMIKTDIVYVRRVLTNLIINAIQAMPQGGNLGIKGYQKGNRVFISVSDTGEGIPEDVKPKLFKPMMTTKAQGQGFGLAVSKRLIEALEGTLSFESEKGKGTTFLIELPL